MEDQRATQDRLSLEEALRQGIRDNAFELHYLPEFSLADGEVTRFEALLRFRHPTQGLLEPRRFLEVAERLGLTPDLGANALDQAARTLALLGTSRPGLSLDLTATQLASLSDPSALAERLARHGLEPGDVAFDFPEDVASEHEVGIRNLLALAQAGFNLTLDDFGAGFCSFGCLRQLPLSSIKIDLFFVEELDTNPQSRELIAAMIAFARRLGIRVVAEGVNSTAQLAFLQDSGCDAVQGYLFGQPLRESELEAYLLDRPWHAVWSAK
jgi:EAL domain-containing protein (putative c-di-GMP-specific phosphodiesterase class I)